MEIRDGLVGAIGNTPLIRLRGASRLTGHTIVTILADSGTRYQSKLFNRAFLAAKGLPVPDWL